MEAYPSGWRGQFAKLLGFARAARVQIPQLPPKKRRIYYVFFICYSSLISFNFLNVTANAIYIKDKISIIIQIFVILKPINDTKYNIIYPIINDIYG